MLIEDNWKDAVKFLIKAWHKSPEYLRAPGLADLLEDSEMGNAGEKYISKLLRQSGLTVASYRSYSPSDVWCIKYGKQTIDGDERNAIQVGLIQVKSSAKGDQSKPSKEDLREFVAFAKWLRSQLRENDDVPGSTHHFRAKTPILITLFWADVVIDNTGGVYKPVAYKISRLKSM